MPDEKVTPEDDTPIAILDLFRIGWAKGFIRAHHAHDMETVEIMLQLAQQLISAVPATRPSHQRLDLVLAAVLRPAALAARSAEQCFRQGLYEPALAQVRTLLELDLTLQYVLSESSEKDQRADRYLAWSYRRRISPLREQLTSPEMVAQLDVARLAWIKERIATFQESMDALAGAAAQNKEESSWHPYKTVKGLAKHLKRLDDYLQVYAPLSGLAVHAADPESQLVVTNNAPRIRSLVTTEPTAVATGFRLLASFLNNFLNRFKDEWNLGESQLGGALEAASMRFVGAGDGSIPAELKPEEWSVAARLTQSPLGDIVEEAVWQLLALIEKEGRPFTEGELWDLAGLKVLQAGESATNAFHDFLEYLVSIGALAREGTPALFSLSKEGW